MLNISVARICKIVFAASILASLASIPFAKSSSAQQITDPSAPLSQRPIVGRSGNGVPQVNITAPKAGVSHNKFDTFNVSPQGVILNNATSSGQSRTGGYVGANPNLSASGAANVIITEVTGRTGSELKGATEVFGARADVILANPNGIACNGCSFLNTGRATLSTGRPVVNGSQVDLHVTNGTIFVEGAGLKTPDGDAALVGRQVIIGAPITAQGEAYVAGGSQYHDHNKRQSRAAPVTSSKKIPYAIDASSLGAMTAGQIRIHGNESGLGVRTYGKLKSRGNVTVRSAGDYAYQDIDAGGSGFITISRDATQYGNITFGQNISVATGSFYLPLNRSMRAGGRIDLSSEGTMRIDGEINARDIRIEARGGLSNPGFILADETLEIVSGDNISNYRRKLGVYDISYEDQYRRYKKYYYRTYRWWWWTWRVRYSKWVNEFVKRVEKRELISEHAAKGGSIAGGEVNLHADSDISNTGGVIASTGDLVLNAGRDISNTYLVAKYKEKDGSYNKRFQPGEILAGGDLSLTAGRDFKNHASRLAAFGNVKIDAKGDVTNYLTAAKYVTEARRNENKSVNSGTQTTSSTSSGSWWWMRWSWTTTQTRSWDTREWLKSYTRDENLALSPGEIASLSGNLSLTASSYDALGSDISAAGDLTLDVKNNIQLAKVSGSENHYEDTDGGRYTNYSNRTTTTGTWSSPWWSYRWSWGSGSSGTRTDSTYSRNDNYNKNIVAASDIIGNNVTLNAGSLIAPGAKLAAQNDLTLNIRNDLVIGGGGSASSTKIAQITEYSNLNSGGGLTNARTLSLVHDARYADSYLGNNPLYRSLALLNQRDSGRAIHSAVRAVGVQSSQSATSEEGFNYTVKGSIRDGQKSFVDALNASGGSTPDIASVRSNLAWRASVDHGLSGHNATANNALYAGHDLTVATNGNLAILAGTRLQARNDVNLRANGAINLNANVNGTAVNGAVVTAGHDLTLSGGNITNRGSTLSAQHALNVFATGNIVNEAVKTNFAYNGRAAFGFKGSRLSAKSGLVLVAGGAIVNRASDIVSDGGIFLQALGDIRNEAESGKYTIEDYYYRRTKKKWYGKRTTTTIIRYDEREALRPGLIEAKGGDLFLNSGRDLYVDGSIIRARDALDLAVARDVHLNARSVELKKINHYSRKRGWFGISLGSALNSLHANRYVNQFAELQGGSVHLNAGGDFRARGATVLAGNELTFNVDGNIIITPLKNNTYYKTRSKNSGWFNSKDYKRATYRTNIARSSATAGRDLTLRSINNNIVLQAANLSAGGDLTLEATRGQIALLTAKEYERVEESRYSANAVWWKSVERGHEAETVLHNHLRAGGAITFRAGNGVIVEYREDGSIDDAIAKLSRAPNLAWMAAIRTQNNVEWRAVEEHFDSWNHEAQGLTQGASAVIALAVVIATQGAATAILPSALASNVVVHAATQAAISSIAARATVSLINNQGDIGAVLEELTSEQGIRALATAVVTAGISAGLSDAILPAVTATAATQSVEAFSQHLLNQAVLTTINTGISTAINGGDFGDNIQAALINTAVSSIGAVAANQIGVAAASGQINKAVQYIAHAALGCGIGAATGGGAQGCAGGAVGAVVGEAVGTFYDEVLAKDVAVLIANKTPPTDLQLQAWIANGVDFSRLAGGLAALAAGGDANAGILAGGNAAEHNAAWAIPILIGRACAVNVGCRTAVVNGTVRLGGVLNQIFANTLLNENAGIGHNGGPPLDDNQSGDNDPNNNGNGTPPIVDPSWLSDVFFGNERKFWSEDPIEFNGNKVYQRNDLIDPNRLDPNTGLTNLQLMQGGYAPYGPDGKKIILHHMLQTQRGPISEVTTTFHRNNFGAIHINTGGLPSGINRSQFDTWRNLYWRNRANDF